MRKLVIHHIGPVKHVDLVLKRINVVIGPQSAGKSCILKVACFCAWAEKRIQLEQGKNGFADFEYVRENLLAFHKLKGFLHEDSRIEYRSDYLAFVIDFANETFDLRWVTRKSDSTTSDRVSPIYRQKGIWSRPFLIGLT